jgi:hypothetical protein
MKKVKADTGMEKEKESTTPAATARAHSSATEPEPLRPILIDLGSRSKKAIKELKRGEGPLLEEVMDALDDVRQSLGEQYKGKTLLPVLVVYRQKQKPASGDFSFVSPFSLLGK